jgi:hypothetical protein
MSYVTFAFVANRPGHDKSKKAKLRLEISAEEWEAAGSQASGA